MLSMEKKYCKRCNSTKAVEEFNDVNKYCLRCLEKNREKHFKNRDKRLEMNKKWYAEHKEEKKAYRKEYNQRERECEVCECKIKMNGWAKHLKTQKHIKNEEEKKENKT